MEVLRFKGGYDRNFSYVIYDPVSKEALVVDPFEDINIYLERAKTLGLKIKGVLNTHKHFDHVQGNKAFQDKGFAIFEKDISIGNEKVEVIFTPGHTKDSVCFLVDKKIFTGDTLFIGKVGGTKELKDTREQYESLKKIMSLPDETIVYPGHDLGVKPDSSIGYEKSNNPFIRHMNESFERFVWIKDNWKQYKEEHGLK